MNPLSEYTVVVWFGDGNQESEVLHVLADGPNQVVVPHSDDRPYVIVAVFAGHIESLYND